MATGLKSRPTCWRAPNEQTGQVDYEVLIPPDATVNLHSSTGPLSAERLQGDLTLEGADATVNVRNVENGHVHVRTMRGPITLTDVRNGHVEIASISGDVHLKSVTGPLVQVNSGSGKIFYDGDFGSGGDYRFTTHTGDIEAAGAGGCLGRFQGALGAGPGAARFSSPTEDTPGFPWKWDVPSLARPARRPRRSCCALSVVKSASSNAEPKRIRYQVLGHQVLGRS